MQQVDIPGTGLRCSKFIFGTASLFNAGGRQTRLRLLAAAVDHGFTHFDTAPLYGFGMAERDLAPVLKANRDITVTTKIGLAPPGGCNQPGAAIFARKAVGRLVKPLSRPVRSFDSGAAQRTLEGSLKRLGRDCIDLYMLHDPLIGEIDMAHWINWLDRNVRAGHVRYYGMATSAGMLEPFLSRPNELTAVVQLLDSLDRKEADILASRGKPMQITYGYLFSAHKHADDRPAAEILRLAAERNRHGAIIVSTKRVDRLPLFGRIAGDAA